MYHFFSQKLVHKCFKGDRKNEKHTDLDFSNPEEVFHDRYCATYLAIISQDKKIFYDCDKGTGIDGEFHRNWLAENEKFKWDFPLWDYFYFEPLDDNILKCHFFRKEYTIFGKKGLIYL